MKQLKRLKVKKHHDINELLIQEEWKVSIKVYSPFLIQYTENQSVFEVDGKTVGECLQDLMKQFPKLKLFDKNHKLLPYVEVSVNGVYCHPKTLAKAVKNGDELHILVVLAGG
jgi:molybdopterin converting factor small subunit